MNSDAEESRSAASIGPKTKHFITGKPFIDYETLVWIVFSIVTVLSAVDRFTWNIWPRQTHSIGQGTAGSDLLDGLKPGPWSVKFYDVFARISGRYTIVALNLLLFTMMHTTMAWLAESWIARHVIDFSKYVEANRRLHTWNGIGIVVMTLVHVWSIVFPCIFDGWRAKVILGSFEWPLSERKPPGVKDVNFLTRTMNLQGDDVFRIVEMTILLGILIPLSIHWLKTRWHLGIHLHSFISVIYFIDIVRRHTHPHSWILNTPVFFAKVIDVLVGYYWRRNEPIFHRMELSSNYLLLFWEQENTLDAIGPKYFLRLKNWSSLERAHVFTGFENRRNLDIAEGHRWTSCLLVRVYNNKRKLRVMRQDKMSHTRRIYQEPDANLYAWGPFLGSMSKTVLRTMRSKKPVTLIAGGSAAGYLIDALQQHNSTECAKLTVLYTTNDGGLFDWMCNVMKEMSGKLSLEDINIVIALTDGNGDSDGNLDKVYRREKELESHFRSHESSDSQMTEGTIRLQHGRLNFLSQIDEGCVTFFQGSGGLQIAVQQACKKKRAKFIAGPTYDQDQRGKNSLFHAMGISCFRGGDDNA